MGGLLREGKQASLEGSFVFSPAIRISQRMGGYFLLQREGNQTGG